MAGARDPGKIATSATANRSKLKAAETADHALGTAEGLSGRSAGRSRPRENTARSVDDGSSSSTGPGQGCGGEGGIGKGSCNPGCSASGNGRNAWPGAAPLYAQDRRSREKVTIASFNSR